MQNKNKKPKPNKNKPCFHFINAQKMLMWHLFHVKEVNLSLSSTFWYLFTNLSHPLLRSFTSQQKGELDKCTPPLLWHVQFLYLHQSHEGRDWDGIKQAAVKESWDWKVWRLCVRPLQFNIQQAGVQWHGRETFTPTIWLIGFL